MFIDSAPLRKNRILKIGEKMKDWVIVYTINGTNTLDVFTLMARDILSAINISAINPFQIISICSVNVKGE